MYEFISKKMSIKYKFDRMIIPGNASTIIRHVVH